MKTNFTLWYAGLLFLVLLSCHKEDDILPMNARLKQVLLYDSINAKEPTLIEEEYEYNKLGQISKVSYFYFDNHFIKYDLFEYNSIGQLIKITDYNANSDSPTGYILLMTYSYTYSSEGKKIKETIGADGREYNLFFYTEGRLSRIENYGYYEKPDALLKYRIFEYDDSGQPIREVLYGHDNVPFEWTINTFSNGSMVKTEIYIDENLENNRRKIYRTFDKNKNLKIVETYEGPYSSGVGHKICKYIYFGE